MLFKGGPTFEETPDAVVLMENHGMFSISVAGDVNGDTLQDVLIIEQYTTTQSSIYLGARNDTGYIIPSRSTGLLNVGGGTSAGAGDLNGDGMPEVIAASGGVARIYIGSKTGFDTVVDAVLDHTASRSSVSVALSSSGITAQ
jgi:FG-GAP-like repeat